jgi:hypothetical protein
MLGVDIHEIHQRAEAEERGSIAAAREGNPKRWWNRPSRALAGVAVLSVVGAVMISRPTRNSYLHLSLLIKRPMFRGIVSAHKTPLDVSAANTGFPSIWTESATSPPSRGTSRAETMREDGVIEVGRGDPHDDICHECGGSPSSGRLV